MKNKLVTIGEALIDFVPIMLPIMLPVNETSMANGSCSFNGIPGGAPANVAASVAKLGAMSSFIGKLGKDSFGDLIIRILRDQGVNAEGILVTSEAKTGLAFVSLKEDGERDFIFYRDPSADMLLSKEDINAEWFSKGDILHFGSISLIQNPSKEATDVAIKYASEKGVLISFDPNIRLPLWGDIDTAITTILEYIPHADILKISEEELVLLTGKSDRKGIDKLFVGNVKLILLTLGSKGSIAYTKEMEIKADGFNVKAIDTTGAGDAFIAGILYKLLQNGVNVDNYNDKLTDLKLLKDIIIFSNANGALTTTQFGAISALPSLEEVIELSNSI